MTSTMCPARHVAGRTSLDGRGEGESSEQLAAGFS